MLFKDKFNLSKKRRLADAEGDEQAMKAEKKKSVPDRPTISDEQRKIEARKLFMDTDKKDDQVDMEEVNEEADQEDNEEVKVETIVEAKVEAKVETKVETIAEEEKEITRSDKKMSLKDRLMARKQILNN